MISLRYYDKCREDRQCSREIPNSGGGCSKGPSYVFSPWEALDRARWRDVYTGLVPRGLLSFGRFWEGVKASPFRVNSP